MGSQMHNLEQRLVYMLHFPFGLEAAAADLQMAACRVKTAEMTLSDSSFEQGAPNSKPELCLACMFFPALWK